MNRRKFLFGSLAAQVMPAIIRTPGLLMPVKNPPLAVRAVIGKFRWGGFSPDDPVTETEWIDSWIGDVSDKKPLAWQDRELRQILTQEFGWQEEVTA
jgi:hypothetical protein